MTSTSRKAVAGRSKTVLHSIIETQRLTNKVIKIAQNYQAIDGKSERLKKDISPSHPMFGQCEAGKVHCPLGSVTEVNTVTWHKKIELFVAGIAKKMGPEMVPRSCWLAATIKADLIERNTVVRDDSTKVIWYTGWIRPSRRTH
ncbi:hypothetical protein HRR80_002743 [Exophiala dermatitidis]|uniref:Uncharacterized protein n=1 Tax=Exophiala dermatitidis TaxID=5970 RepID=A0AAN6EZQ1_EXODE|nr:hypothetical protein HRR80_002743 [Exophiala dermatitidis]